MGNSEFFKIVPMELQEKAMLRSNLVESLSRRSSIFPGHSPLDLVLGAVGSNNCDSDIPREEEEEDTGDKKSDVDNTPKPLPFPYKNLTNEKLKEIRNSLGIIDLSFTPVPSDEFVNVFPVTYYSWTEKEQLLLVFAENFRRQFNERYKWRPSLLMAPRNECGIQVIVQVLQ